MKKNTLFILALLCLQVFCNPFANKKFYVNPTFKENIDRTINNMTPSEPNYQKIVNNLKIARDVPSAYWLDVMKKVQPDSTGLDTMNGILLDAAKQSPAPMVVFIIYDLPNRDCNAKASNGELCCYTGLNGRCDYLATGNCGQGISIYKNNYIDNIVKIINKFKNVVPMAFVIEPDSFPNLVTNIGNPACGNFATQAAYREGIQYAINSIPFINNGLLESFYSSIS